MAKLVHRLVWGAAVVELVAVVATAGYLVRRDAGKAVKCEAAPVVRAEAGEADEAIFWVRRGDWRYHRRSCRYVRSCRTAVRLSEAKQRWRPCPRCKPTW